MLTELSLQYQLISMTPNVKQLKMLAKSQDYKYKESSINQQQLLLPMECKRSKTKQLQSMIWEEEHSIFPFLRFPKELLKLKQAMAIHPVVDKILTE